MTLPRKLVAGLALAALAALFLWRARGTDRAVPAAAPAVSAPALTEAPQSAAAPAPPAPEVSAARTALAVEEKPAEPAVPEPFGTLLVRVRWWDKTPAGEIHARVEPSWTTGNPSWRARAAVTDAQGEFRLERLPPGRALVAVDRGNVSLATIAAGEEALLEVELERGFDVSGVVLDPAGRTVSDAEIWLSYPFSFEEGQVVAHTGADGRFQLRSCRSGAMGARAARFAPSLLQALRAADGAELTLEFVLMGPGGELAGTVLDPKGHAVPAALVLVGEYRLGTLTAVPVGGERPLTGMRPGRHESRTDVEGRYVVRGLAPGVQPVIVRASGFAPWRGEAEVFAHGSAALDVRLVPGVALEGFVFDREGQPLTAEIRVGPPTGPLSSQTATAADGSYRLADLAPGEFEVVAEGEDGGTASATLRGAAGETVYWEALLAHGGEIRGRLIDEQGAGVPGWFLWVEDEPPLADDKCGRVSACKTDAEGRFVAEGLGDHPHRVEAHPEGPVLFPAAIAGGVYPDREECLLRIDPALRPSVRIRGAVVDENDRAVGSAQLQLVNRAFSRTTVEVGGDDGRFELGPYPAGVWRLRVSSPELSACPELNLGPRELGPGETWDCGTIVLRPGGTLRVRARAPVNATPELVVLQGTVSRGKLHAEGAEWRSDPLAPGEYRLALRGAGVAAALVPFEIRAREATVLVLPLAAGSAVSIRVLADTGGTRQQPLLTITDASGTTLVEEDLWLRKSGDHGLELALAPGTYRVEARLPGGAHAATELVVGTGDVPPVVLELH